MNWLIIRQRIAKYQRQLEEGLIDDEEWRRATLEFLASAEVETCCLRSAYAHTVHEFNKLIEKTK